MSSRNEVFLACTMACAIQTGCAQIIGIEDLPPLLIDAGPSEIDAGLSEIDAGPSEIDAGPPVVQKAITATDKVDLLIIVDNSESMKDEQISLAANFPVMIDRLQAQAGLPDVHIGIVSTDMVAHPSIPDCKPEDSDDGVLQSSFTNDPDFSQCSDGSLALDGTFIRDAPATTGGRITNYTGNLTDVFACMAVLGIEGCGFEFPLAAMRRAFENPANAGFLREDATLAVIFLSDEDDCSAFDQEMFNPTITGKESYLGPLDSFRCFEFGVECNPDQPRVLGEKYECKPREDSPYMVAVQEYVDYLRGLKADPQQIVVAGIVGVDPVDPDKPLEVINETKPVGEVFSLVPACRVVNGDGMVVAKATPAVRLRAFLDAFPGRNALTSICEQDLRDAMDILGALIGHTMSQRWCLPADVDRLPVDPGIQHTCQVSERSYDGDPTATPLAACSSDTPAPGELPCWYLVSPSERCEAEAPVELVIRRAALPPSTAQLEVTCNAP
ncbi:MAG TPA: hypothetical protein VNM90_24800 [Haliangium sp.]|nr:hypothetical protein [Haliangium sp.]